MLTEISVYIAILILVLISIFIVNRIFKFVGRPLSILRDIILGILLFLACFAIYYVISTT